MRALVLSIAIFLNFITGHPAFSAEAPSTSSDETTDFINPSIAVASRLGTDLRSAPSVVTEITSEEIARSGARDMNDVLMMVPGFFPGVDTQGVTDFGMRGLWAHEGKMAVLIDGREYNENAYGTNQFGNHFPVQLIDRVEVIRGPGSALYGGYSELAVVNIVTKSGKNFEGKVFAGTQVGFTEHTFGQENISLGYGNHGKDYNYSLTGFIGQGQRSDRNYTDNTGATTNLTNQSTLNPFMANLGVNYKDLTIRFIADRYHTQSVDWYGVNEDVGNPNNNDFFSYLGNIGYKIHLTNDWSMTPEIRYRYMNVWQNTMPGVSPTDTDYWDYPTQRIKYKIGSNYNLSQSVKLNFGFETIDDKAKDNNTQSPSQLQNGALSVEYWSTAAYGELFYDLGLAQLTVGGRYETNTFAGGNFAPRLALVKLYDYWHWKFMAGKAFKNPAIFNIAANNNIVSETTTSVEAEIGYEPNSQLAISLNLYDIRITNPIIYTATAQGNSIYANEPEVGSVGAELETRYAAGWGETRLNYSYYRADHNQVSAYSVAQSDSVLLAFPGHKLALQSSVKLDSKDLRLTTTLIAFSDRYAYLNASNPPSDLNAMVMINLNLKKNNFLTKDLTGSIGIFNLTNADFNIAQPYFGSGAVHPPLPTLSREYVAQLTYQF